MALRWAIRQARLTGAVVEAVIAWQYPASTAGYAWAPMMMPGVIDYEEISEKTVAEAISSAANAGSDVKISTIVREGNAAEALIDAAAHADLLVVGSRGHGGFTGALLGTACSTLRARWSSSAATPKSDRTRPGQARPVEPRRPGGARPARAQGLGNGR
jgi:nucleotide-binding universal stress UspA family protein